MPSAAARPRAPSIAVTPTTRPAFAFPNTYSSNRRYLQDQRRSPFPILGRTAWFVIALTPADYQLFINDTVARGHNAIEMHVINHDPRGRHPPRNGQGELPLSGELDGAEWSGALSYSDIATDAPDFTTPNPAYWCFVDAFLDYCESSGILVCLLPRTWVMPVASRVGCRRWLRMDHLSCEPTANGSLPDLHTGRTLFG